MADKQGTTEVNLLSIMQRQLQRFEHKPYR